MPIKHSNKHAFLIMAHTQPNLLKRLLKRLDNKNVDIFLHLDKKTDFNETEIIKSVKKSDLYLTPRLTVTWGGYSIIQAELLLLDKAINTGRYKYYHLLSGQDYLLKNINEILSFYDKVPDLNYISFKNDEVLCYIDRLRLKYPFQNMIGRTHSVLYYLQRLLTITQRKLKHYRTIPELVGFGSQFFDITDDFARWIVKKQTEWISTFTNTICADEMFIQTLYLIYKKENNTQLCFQEETDFKSFDRAGLTIKRAIDWKRGRPYVWCKEDYEALTNSQLLFVRKVDETKSKELLDILDETTRDF